MDNSRLLTQTPVPVRHGTISGTFETILGAPGATHDDSSFRIIGRWLVLRDFFIAKISILLIRRLFQTRRVLLRRNIAHDPKVAD